MRILRLLRWLLAAMMAVAMFVPQVGPHAAISNVAEWLDFLGIHPIPIILKAKTVDQWVAIGAGFTLVALSASWIIEYQILRRYVRRYGGAATFETVAPQQRKAILYSFLVAILVAFAIVLVAYHKLSRPYQLNDRDPYLRIIGIIPVFPTTTDHRFAIHFFQRNVGRMDATSVIHLSNTYRISETELTDDDLDSDFNKAIDRLKSDLTKKKGATIEPETESYFSYGWNDGGDIIAKVETGVIRFYVYWLSLYRGRKIPQDTYIATEACFYIMPTHAFANCSSHNGRFLVR